MVQKRQLAEKTSLHQDVKQRLIARFQDFALDAKLPSTRVLADEVGASYVTISRVMQEIEWEGYVRRVPRKGTYLASRERVVSKDNQTGTIQLKTILFAFPNWTSLPNWNRLCDTEELAIKEGMAVYEYKMNRESTYEGIKSIVDERSDICAVIIIPAAHSIGAQEIALFDSFGVPVILHDECDHVACSQNVWAINPDWYQAGYLAMQTLIESGHRKLAYLPTEHGEIRQKLFRSGIRQALKDGGLKLKDLTLLGNRAKAWEDSREAGYLLFKEAMAAGGFSAVLFDTVASVQGATKAAWELGVKVPDDISFLSACSSDNEEAYFAPPLTTMSTSRSDEIRMIFDCLLKPDTIPTRKILLPSAVFERASIKRL